MLHDQQRLVLTCFFLGGSSAPSSLVAGGRSEDLTVAVTVVADGVDGAGDADAANGAGDADAAGRAAAAGAEAATGDAAAAAGGWIGVDAEEACEVSMHGVHTGGATAGAAAAAVLAIVSL